MRKILLVLTVLALTSPCWAAVSVSCSAVGDEVTVSYNCASDANDIRAFGIQVSVDNGGVISNIDVNDADYYIFPGSIDINSQGGVEGWGSAVVSQTSSGFTLEMGSLYDPCDPDHKVVPPKSGTLCTFTVTVPKTGCTVSLAKDTSRGGVVMEDGEDYATLSGVVVPYDGCYPAGMADWDEWDVVGRPECWCYPRQCHGDVDGYQEPADKSGVPPAHWVGVPDLQVMAQAWEKPLNEVKDITLTTSHGAIYLACADINHTEEPADKSGVPPAHRVGVPDLQILTYYWQETNVPAADCTPGNRTP